MTDISIESTAQPETREIMFAETSHIQNDIFPHIEGLGVQCDANRQYWSDLKTGTLLEASEKIYNDQKTQAKVLLPICITAIYTIGVESPQIINDRLVLKILELTDPAITESRLLTIARFVKKNKMVGKAVLKVLKQRIKGKLPAMEISEDWT